MPSKNTKSNEDAGNAQEAKPSREVLDLIDPPKKKRVRKKAATTATQAPKSTEPAEPEKKTLADRRAEALNLFEEQESKAERKRTRPAPDRSAAGSSSMLPPLSARSRPAQKVEAETPDPVADEEVQVDEVEDAAEATDDARVINIKPPILVKDLAEKMGLKPHKLIAELLKFDVFASPSHSLDPEVAGRVCEAHGFIFEKEKREKGGGVHKADQTVEEPPPPQEPVEVEEVMKLPLRPPIITFMGHVDHGKTSLLDALRKSRVVSGEAGGITQHIGAYSVATEDGRRITFIDTPGHAAFTEMRARGANVTDIVVLVVAADDGFMPQTVEALNHAKAAGVTIMVAINKCDLPAADPDRVRRNMQENGLTPEEWGGDTIALEVSATTGQGLDQLLELMALQAEILELHANPDLPARGVIIESRLQPGKGPTATVIVQSGTLKMGKSFICGPFSGKVKSMISDDGEIIKEAGPAMPVEVVGFNGLPNVGDEIVQMDSDRSAKKLSEERQEDRRQTKLNKPKKSTLENLLSNLADGPKKVLKVVLKTDVQGSAEAIANSLSEVKSEKIELDIIHAAAGAISESDILLGSASDAIVIGFNVKVESKAVAVARREDVQVKLFSIIYELIDQVKEAMLGMLDPEHRENVIGHAKVKQVFKLTRGIVAGSVVTDGRIKRNARARVIRGGQPVYDGGFATLRRFKDDVAEVRNGLECGIRLGDFVEYMEDDIIECYELERIAQSL